MVSDGLERSFAESSWSLEKCGFDVMVMRDVPSFRPSVDAALCSGLGSKDVRERFSM